MRLNKAQTNGGGRGEKKKKKKKEKRGEERSCREQSYSTN